MVIAMIEGATETIQVEIEIGMMMDMIQDTTIEKNLGDTKIEIMVGNPTDHLEIAAIEIVTVARGDDLIAVEMALVIHVNTMDTVENEIVVLIKDEDNLRQDITIVMTEKIMVIEDTHLTKGKLLFTL